MKAVLLAFSLLFGACEAPKPAPQPVAKPTVKVVEAFEADWCGPCQAAKPKLAELAKQGIAIKVVDCTKTFPKGIDRVPTFRVYQDGVNKGEVQGLANLLILLKLLKWIL